MIDSLIITALRSGDVVAEEGFESREADDPSWVIFVPESGPSVRLRTADPEPAGCRNRELRKQRPRGQRAVDTFGLPRTPITAIRLTNAPCIRSPGSAGFLAFSLCPPLLSNATYVTEVGHLRQHKDDGDFSVRVPGAV